MSTKILIRHCPHCAQLVHFAPQDPAQMCWNCGQFSDLSRVLSAHEVILRAISTATDRVLPALPWAGFEMTPSLRRGKFVLTLGIPALVCMLFLYDGFDVHPIGDWLTSSFGSSSGTGACSPITGIGF